MITKNVGFFPQIVRFLPDLSCSKLFLQTINSKIRTNHFAVWEFKLNTLVEPTIMINRCKSNRGQTIIEFAFIMVLLFIFILGIMEWGIILYDKAILTHACREGTRAGVVYRADSSSDFGYMPLTAAEIRTVVNNDLQGRLVTFGAPFDPASDITPRWSTNGGATWTATTPGTHGNGEELRVEVDFAYTFLALRNLVGLAGGSLGTGTLNLSARSIMRME
jgi:Flp pilus assembly protein TadG